jgi:hypothetical protein
MEELSVRVGPDMGLQDSHRHLQAGQVAQGVISAVINACQQDASTNPDGPMRFATFFGEGNANLLRQLWMKHLRSLTSESEPNILPIAATTLNINTTQLTSSSSSLPSGVFFPVPAFRTEIDGIHMRCGDIQDLGGSSSGSYAPSAWKWEGASISFGDPDIALDQSRNKNGKFLPRQLQYQGSSQLSYEFAAPASRVEAPAYLSASENEFNEQTSMTGLMGPALAQVPFGSRSGNAGFNFTIPIGDAEACSDAHSRYLGFPFLGLKLSVYVPAVSASSGVMAGISEWSDARVVHMTYLSERGRKTKSSRRNPAISRLTHVLLRFCKDGREVLSEWPSECLRHAVEGDLDYNHGVNVLSPSTTGKSSRSEVRNNPSLADLMREADAEKFGALDSSSDSDSYSDSESDMVSARRVSKVTLSQNNAKSSGNPLGNASDTDTDSDSDDDDSASGFDIQFLQEYRRNFRYQMALRALLRMDDTQFEHLRRIAGINAGSSKASGASDDIAAFWRIGQLSLVDKQRLRARVQESESHWQDEHAVLFSSSAATSNPRILVVAHDNTLLLDTACAERQSVVDVNGLLKREYYTKGGSSTSSSDSRGQIAAEVEPEPDAEAELRASSAAASKGMPMMHGVCHQRIRLRTGGVDGNTRFRLQNAFVGNRGGVHLRTRVDSQAIVQAGNTRKCMVLPEIVVELDTQKHFGKSRGGAATEINSSLLRDRKRRRK